MNVQMEDSWKEILAGEFQKEYFVNLSAKVRGAYLGEQTVYPPPGMVFNAFAHCPFKQVKVVILGQDPYINPGEAMGLAFSVPDSTRIPPSLLNIFKEIRSDIGAEIPTSGNLERWADQGVLLLNATLTVEARHSASHQGWGWEQFTDAVIKRINNQKEHVVFMLWGRYARSKKHLIDETKHLVLEAAHPSPLAAHKGFFGCRHFSQANKYLKEHDDKSIEW